jgi:SAM-dependent methyltransferase
VFEQHQNGNHNDKATFDEQIQFTFGEEWTTYDQLIPDHDEEFSRYFDLLDLRSLRECRVLDAGSGIGRWAIKIEPHVKELVCVDFSDAIFLTARHLANSEKTLCVMADVTKLPFRQRCFDLIYSLGVLHHLPTSALEAVRQLKKLSEALLIYVYYALDNRPSHFRWMFRAADILRRVVCKVRNHWFRWAFAKLITAIVYQPLVGLGNLAQFIGKGEHVPLWSFYHGKTFRRIEQDVYDRFFTGIEQRFSRAEIEKELTGDFHRIVFSDIEPYWHFMCLGRSTTLALNKDEQQEERRRRAA